MVQKSKLQTLRVQTSEVETAHSTAPAEEKLHTRPCPEFGNDEGKFAIIVRALCGTESAGVSL